MPDPTTALILGGTSAGAQIWGAQSGANAIRGAANQGLSLQERMFNRGANALDPFINAGADVLPTLKKLLTPGPGQTDTLSMIPGFKFAQDWGQKSVENLAGLRGWGGNTIAAGSQFATGLAQQNFFPLIQALQGLVSTGSGAAGSLLGAGTTAGSNMSNLLMQGGQATAGANISTGNTLSGLINNFGGLSFLDKLSGGKLIGMYGNPNAQQYPTPSS